MAKQYLDSRSGETQEHRTEFGRSDMSVPTAHGYFYNAKSNQKRTLETDLIAYSTTVLCPTIAPTNPKRQWMDATPGHSAYLCLPMVVANCTGWELLSPVSFRATWNGSSEKDAIAIESDGDRQLLPISHFGSGILTFHVAYVFRTSPGHNLYVKGPANRPKDGIAPLEGVVETDWLPNIFTMNWKFTRPNHTVVFESGEPFCCIFPMPRRYINKIKPVIFNIEEAPDVEAEFRAWCKTRTSDKKTRYQQGFKFRRKDYLEGKTASGKVAPDHERVVRVHAFDDRRSREDLHQREQLQACRKVNQ
jgi:hypothetical protein